MRAGRRRAARCRAGVRPALVGVALLALAPLACQRPLGELADLRMAPAPVERLPYITGVTDQSATIVWRARASSQDSFEYRTEADSSWRTAEIDRGPVLGQGVHSDSVQDREVHLSGLPRGAEVEYRVEIDTIETGTIAFNTAPAPGTEAELTVLAFGDSGWGSPSQLRLAEVIENQQWDLALHMGDLAYSEGTRADFTLRHFGVYPVLMATVPLYPVPGDHDLRTEGGAPYDESFDWPAPAEGARYYVFRWGRVLFVALDTPEGQPPGRLLRQGRGPQLEWLRDTLERTSSDPTVDWTIAYMHNPIYSHAVGLGGHGHDQALQRVLGPLFDRYGVDLVLAGHDHHYERTKPIRNGEPVPSGCGPVYVVTGGGGASRVARGLGRSYLTAVATRQHEILRLQISGDRILGEALGEDGAAIDEFSLVPYEAGAGGTASLCR